MAFALLLVHVPPPFPFACRFLPSMDYHGAAFAILRPVGLGDKSLSALGAAFEVVGAEDLRLQSLVLRQHRPAEPLAGHRIGNSLRTNTGFAVVQRKTVAVIVIAAAFPYQLLCRFELSRRHAIQRAVRFSFYLR